MTQEALKLALQALEANYLLVNGTETHGGLEQFLDGYYSGCFNTAPINKQTEEAITAIKEALAQTQEPVAWMKANDTEWSISFFEEDGYVPLYTAPPQEQQSCDKRTWVGLTDEERFEVADISDCFEDVVDAVEAKLKDKNEAL